MKLKLRLAFVGLAMADPIRWQLLNLHDSFMNANLVREVMLKTPPNAPDGAVLERQAMEVWARAQGVKLLVGDRFRLERLWWALMYVLIEAWKRKSQEAHELFSKLDSTPALEAKLKELRKAGTIDKLMECRHYMFHRDRRDYWDDGRMAPLGQLEELRELSRRFGSVFLEAFDRMKGTGGEGGT